MKKEKLYYKKFLYRIEKKLSVEDDKNIKDYAKEYDCYIYIIHDNMDNNRFIFLSSQHYEENTIIRPEQFKLSKINDLSESLQIKSLRTKFGDKYFKLSKEEGDFSLLVGKFGSTQKVSLYKKYKTHTKKIAIDNPMWAITFLNNLKLKSFQKKLMKDSLYENEYDNAIKTNYISTLFQLKDRKYQMFNDHSLMMDEGKTGKTSMVSYMSKKADNVSIAGLYGSSDGKAGKFRGGLVTLTNRTIVIDELNELAENKGSEKVLSILNTILENGEYNYIKQFSATIESSNQFIFLGNISDKVNFPVIVDSTFGNTETIGRRIGIVTYSNKLEVHTPGKIRPYKPSEFLYAISNYMSLIMNYILYDTKFIEKIFAHRKYKELADKYKKDLTKVEKQIEEEVTIQFIRSHKSSINRIVLRALKMYIYDNLDLYLRNEKPLYQNVIVWEVLVKAEEIMNENVINFENIKEHIQNFSMEDRKAELNRNRSSKIPKSYLELLIVFHKNKNILTAKGTNYEELEKSNNLKHQIQNMKNRGVTDKLKSFLRKYGCRITSNQNIITLGFMSRQLFESQTQGLFEEEEKVEIDASGQETEIETIDMDII